MTIENTVFTFVLSDTFEERVKMFDSSDIDEFHKTVRLNPLDRGKSLIDPKEIIFIHQAEESVWLNMFFQILKPLRIKNLEGIFIARLKSQVRFLIN
tara:strand:- start:211 stop:501 length:291 start_codon:yes stop_codon:yes gene_type:complete